MSGEEYTEGISPEQATAGGIRRKPLQGAAQVRAAQDPVAPRKVLATGLTLAAALPAATLQTDLDTLAGKIY
jgi:hypothetical protein